MLRKYFPKLEALKPDDMHLCSGQMDVSSLPGTDL